MTRSTLNRRTLLSLIASAMMSACTTPVLVAPNGTDGLSREEIAQVQNYMRTENLESVIVADGYRPVGPVAQLDQAMSVLGNTVVARSDAALLHHFYDKMPKEWREFVAGNISHVVFQKGLTANHLYQESPVAGLSLGGGIVKVNAFDEKDTPRTPNSIAQILVHEAQHENNQQLNLSTLQDETAAYAAQYNFVSGLLKDAKGVEKYELEATTMALRERVRSGQILSKPYFNNIFDDVYPDVNISAKHLIGRNISNEALTEIVSRNLNDYVGAEIHAAAMATLTVQEQSREDALQILQDRVLSSPRDDLQIINSLYALNYLAPTVMAIEEYPTAQRRGVGIDFGDRKDHNKVVNFLPNEKFNAWFDDVIQKNRGKGMMFELPTDPSKYAAYGNMPPMDALTRDSF